MTHFKFTNFNGSICTFTTEGIATFRAKYASNGYQD